MTLGLILAVLVLGLLIRHLFFWHPLDNACLYRDDFLLFGHRGSSKDEPENTLPAFRKAVADGCNAVELDVHLTRDGQLVVIHDPSLERTTDGRGPVADKTLNELKQLNAASHYGRRREQIPTLNEVVDVLPEHIVINIEIKNHRFRSPQKIEKEVVRFVRREGLRDRCIVSSFNPFVIWRVKRADPGIFTAQLWYKRDPSRYRYPLSILLTHPDFIHPHLDFIDPAIRFWSHRKGLPLHVWVVNDAAIMKAMSDDERVRGIMSDDTALLTSTLN